MLNTLTEGLSSRATLKSAHLKLKSDMNHYLAPGAGSDAQAIFQLRIIAMRMLNKLQSQIPAIYIDDDKKYGGGISQLFVDPQSLFFKKMVEC